MSFNVLQKIIVFGVNSPSQMIRLASQSKPLRIASFLVFIVDSLIFCRLRLILMMSGSLSASSLTTVEIVLFAVLVIAAIGVPVKLSYYKYYLMLTKECSLQINTTAKLTAQHIQI